MPGRPTLFYGCANQSSTSFCAAAPLPNLFAEVR